jgi:tellurite resistance protein
MALRRLFRTDKEPETVERPPAPSTETETVRKIVAQLEALPIEQRRFVAGFAYVLGRAAHADLVFGPEELAAIERAVLALGGLSEAQAVLVVEIARSQAELYGATEDYLVTREFARVSSLEERERLLRAAFAVGAADQSITSVESAELNEIGKELGFTDGEVDAIRNEFRDSLSVVQAMRAHLGETPPGG